VHPKVLLAWVPLCALPSSSAPTPLSKASPRCGVSLRHGLNTPLHRLCPTGSSLVAMRPGSARPSPPGGGVDVRLPGHVHSAHATMMHTVQLYNMISRGFHVFAARLA